MRTVSEASGMGMGRIEIKPCALAEERHHLGQGHASLYHGESRRVQWCLLIGHEIFHGLCISGMVRIQ